MGSYRIAILPRLRVGSKFFLATLASAVRSSDFAGRYGGEEFLLLLPETGTDGAVSVAEYLRTTLSAISIPGIDRRITASFGIAVLPDHAGDAATLIRQADRALYSAKAASRDRVEVVADTSDDTSPVPAGQRASADPDR
jgi:diguanylate cyclase (GGDEF)-like protein